MKIYSVYDPEFKPYGRVLEGYDTTCLMNAVKTIPRTGGHMQLRRVPK